MSKFQDSLICDGCGAEITWSPVVRTNRHYCCEDCSNGLPCDCAARQEIDEENHLTPSSAPTIDQLA
jgi:hypothetical protein